MDKKAKQILIKTHWASTGWKSSYDVTKEDFEYAKSKGVMFDPIAITHDEVVQQLLKLKQEITFQEILKGFLVSLSTRDLRLRSSLLSYLEISNLKRHNFEAELRNSSKIKYCAICGAYEKEENVNLNVQNFERIKWGGVRHASPIYCLFDLKLFRKMNIPEPSKSDILTLEAILLSFESIAPKGKIKDLEKHLKNVIESNSEERKMLIDIFAMLRILAPPHEDWLPYYVLKKEWRGKDKYRKEFVTKFFGPWL